MTLSQTFGVHQRIIPLYRSIREREKMKSLIQFMASSYGRVLRFTAGVALMGIGIVVIGGTTGALVALIGGVPLLAGLFDFCVFAPLFGQPFMGARIRATK